MSNSIDCNKNSDPLKLIRDGANQEQRLSPALDPSYVPVNEHDVANEMMFARALSEFVKYFDSNNTANGNWAPFFSKDPSLRLAVTSIQNIEDYKTQIKSYFDFLNNLDNELKGPELVNNLSYIYSCLGTLAKQLDGLKEGLPAEIVLKATLNNLVRTQLAPAMQRLISYQKAGIVLGLVKNVAPTDSIQILGVLPDTFDKVLTSGFSMDWITSNAADWNVYVASISAESSVYGDSTGNPLDPTFVRTNYIATHNLFTSVSDQFLKVFARVIGEARLALEFTFTNWDKHEPHYALFLSFLRLMEYARNEANTITGRHLDFYYREVLQLKAKPALPAKAHLIVELAKQAASLQIKPGELFKAGKDDKGIEAFFANNRDLIANQSKVTSLKTLYHHGNEAVGDDDNSNKQSGRLYASSIANSADGLGAKLISADLSWQPFYNKTYQEGVLKSINMPKAEVGFAIASHYLLMAEGTRTITLEFTISGFPKKYKKGPEKIIAESKKKRKNALEVALFEAQRIRINNIEKNLKCLITTKKGWLEKTPGTFTLLDDGRLQIKVELSGADPAVRPYLSKVHGYSFSTDLPVMMVKLKNEDTDSYIYDVFQMVETQSIDLTVEVDALKTLVVSNDFGPVDTSKPFQPFGANPITESSLIIGSKEIFQKNLISATVNTNWQTTPTAYGKYPNVEIDYLNSGVWTSSQIASKAVGSTSFELSYNLDLPVIVTPDLTADESFNTNSTHGFVRLRLDNDFGQKDYMTALLVYLATKPQPPAGPPAGPPVGPFMNGFSITYTAKQTIDLSSSSTKLFDSREAQFLHISPFGFAEQHSAINKDKKAFLLPQFDFQLGDIKNESEAEFYIGVTGLLPPQNLSLLFQVADGTANPLTVKPNPHLHWSYLKNNEWIDFETKDIEDQTGELLKSGIVTLAFPSDATNSNNFLPFGEYWIRIAVWNKSDAVCNLIMVAAQALQTTFVDKGNDPAFASNVLPAETISKLSIPVSEVKKITQPFESFGGRGAEISSAFYTRVSERLRHKNRAVSLWDYERLVLEAFPEIFRVKCLNHTQYEPSESGSGIYKELAPGHVTIVTVPNKQFHNLRDPLRPYTSLGMLTDIAEFIGSRVSCFVKLHVNNPQFEEVRVNMSVRFYDGFDETFYTNTLQESILRFLSPWAFPDGGNPTFGGKVYKSVLIDFVEEQLYVDYITDVQLFQDIAGVKGTVDQNEIEGSLAVSILVSVPAKQHLITVINPSEEKISSDKCSCES